MVCVCLCYVGVEFDTYKIRYLRYFLISISFSSCDGFSDSQYDEMNGGSNGGDHYAWNRMAEDDYCKGIDNSTNIATFSPGQAWCLPKDYNQEKTPFTCK